MDIYMACLPNLDGGVPDSKESGYRRPEIGEGGGD